MNNLSRTLKLTIAYDGTAYCGWQTQPNGVSIQSTLMQAIQEFTAETPVLYAAGRTDAGVHAVGQVVSFSTTSPVPAANFRPALQRFLPDDIVIRHVEDVAPGFHAQFHARLKTYRYLFHNAPVWSPFYRQYALWHRTRLDESAMDYAIRQIVGTFDFRSLETQWPNRKTSVRTVVKASVQRIRNWNLLGENGPPTEEPKLDPEGEFLCMEITANGFLYNMVRTIAGTLIHIGRGKWGPEKLREIVDLQDRRRAGETAPAHGLYLWHVDYVPTTQSLPDGDLLPAADDDDPLAPPVAG